MGQEATPEPVLHFSIFLCVCPPSKLRALETLEILGTESLPGHALCPHVCAPSGTDKVEHRSLQAQAESVPCRANVLTTVEKVFKLRLGQG